MGSRYANADMWRNAADQAVSVAAKAFVACAGTNVANLTDTGIWGALNVAAAAALVSLATSIAETPPADKRADL